MLKGFHRYEATTPDHTSCSTGAAGALLSQHCGEPCVRKRMCKVKQSNMAMRSNAQQCAAAIAAVQLTQLANLEKNPGCRMLRTPQEHCPQALSQFYPSPLITACACQSRSAHSVLEVRSVPSCILFAFSLSLRSHAKALLSIKRKNNTSNERSDHSKNSYRFVNSYPHVLGVASVDCVASAEYI